VTEKRGAFKRWTVLLAILAFSLSLLGTFLVRSGVLSSVHAFATDPRRGLFILGFLVVVTGSSLLLYAWRAPRIGLGAPFDAASRESMLLANNVVLAAATGTVLLGTLYPLLLDALDLGKLSVGPPYFETVLVPLMTVLLLLAGVGPLVRWRGAALGEVLRPLRRPVLLMALGSLAGAVGLSAWAGGVRPGPVLGLFLALWVLSGVLVDLRPWVVSRRWVPRATLGMMLAHLGVAAFAVGVTMVRSYEIESDQRVAPGQAVVLQDLSFRFMGVRDLVGPNYTGLQAEVEVRDGERVVAVLHPEKRVYRVQRNPMTEAAIQPGFTRDLYVSLGEEVAPDVWTLRLYIKPFVDWIWGGCLLMALGGALAASDRRYRRPAARVEPVAPSAPPTPQIGRAHV
jgi:cytochrome c-type biogenesis protein CcmF